MDTKLPAIFPLPRGTTMTARRVPGSVEQQASGRWRAYYTHARARHTPGRTFTTEKAAVAWLTAERALIDKGTWTPPADRRADAVAQAEADAAGEELVGAYARRWVAGRTTAKGTPLSARTVQEYHRYLTGILRPLAIMPLNAVTRADVEQWWQANDGVPRLRHHAYSFAKSVFADAVERGVVGASPCRVVNAARVSPATPRAVRASMVNELTTADVEKLADAMPGRHRFLVLLLAWTGLRPGEAFALRRTDLQTSTDAAGVSKVRINAFVAVTKGAEGGPALVAGAPKTPGSVRSVLLPPHLAADLERHLSEHAAPGVSGLLFPSSTPALDYCTVQQVTGTSAKRRTDRGGHKVRTPSGWNAARLAVGRPGLRLYDLRHWARRQWTRAGLDTATVEMLLGHELPTVQGAYAHLDLDHVWPFMVRCSEAAGWSPPVRPAASALGISPRLLNAMTTDQLSATLAAMTPEQLAAAVPHLDPATLARVLGAGESTGGTAIPAR